METKESSALQFTDEHYIALGKMVIAFQDLEEAITYGIAFLMHPEDQRQALGFTHTVLNELPFTSRLKLLSNYIETHPIEHFIPSGTQHEKVKLEDFKEILGSARLGISMAFCAEEKRNQFIHSRWLTAPLAGPAGHVLRIKIRAKHKKTQASAEYVTASAIYEVVEEMDKATSLIFRATRDLHHLLLDK